MDVVRASKSILNEKCAFRESSARDIWIESAR